ncbi:MAG: DUF3857 domain-containing protein [Bacteroidetes bacterium]|nr:DUF3857 domain-containing protein [Bacteroidota bacterium]
MTFRKLLLFICFLLFVKANAQNFELGKVSLNELEEKRHPTDSAAVAAILFEKGKNTFEYSQSDGFILVTEVNVRIKIYKKQGYEWANKSVRYYGGNYSKDRVSFSDAVTYNVVDGKIEKTKLKSDGEFDEVVNKYWKEKKITMPNVKEGSVIEFSYTLRSTSISSPRDWYFQRSIPVNYSEYKINTPEYFVYNASLKGFLSPKVTTEKGDNSVVLNSKQRESFGYTTKTTFSQDKIDFSETRTTYVIENVPALKEESFVNNTDNYVVSLVQELSMTKYPNEPAKFYATDWNAVVKTIYDYDDFGPELSKTGYFEDDLKVVLTGLTTTESKIDAIFKHVKTTVKWNDYYGYSCNDGVKKAYKDKTGNIAEINLMLTAMLRYAGFDANPVLVSTRSNGIALFPNRNAFNYVIVALQNGGSTVLLDASDVYSIPNVLPFRALNWLGRLIRKDGSSDVIDLMPSSLSNDLTTMSYAIDDKGMVSGKYRRQQDNYNAMISRNAIKSIKEESYLEKLENDNNKIEIQDYKRTNEKELQMPLVESIVFTGSNFSEIIGSTIYIRPLLSFASSENPFRQENRLYPVDFGFPFMDKYIINITIPDGYEVEKIPEAINLVMDNSFASFKCMTSVSGNTIQMMVTNQMNTPIVAADHYSTLKEYYQKLTDKQNEKIVLRKI